MRPASASTDPTAGAPNDTLPWTLPCLARQWRKPPVDDLGASEGARQLRALGRSGDAAGVVPGRERARGRLRGRKRDRVLPGWSRSHDHLGQHGNDAPEQLVSSVESFVFAEIENTADVERGRALCRRPTSQPVEARLLGRTELAGSFRCVEADRSRRTSKLICKRTSPRQKRANELFSVNDELEGCTVGVELTVIEVSHHQSCAQGSRTVTCRCARGDVFANANAHGLVDAAIRSSIDLAALGSRAGTAPAASPELPSARSCRAPSEAPRSLPGP